MIERTPGLDMPDTRTHCSEGGRTHQSFKDDCDINTIMGRWRTTGFIEHVKLGTPVYGDFSDESDYMEKLNALERAQALFDSLPARVRARVENDPGKLIAFVEDPANAEELVELGLREPVSREPVAPATEEVTEPPPQDAGATQTS